MNPLWGVLLGGGLTLLGTTVVEVIKARAGSRQRVEQRAMQGSDFSRAVVEEVRSVALRYRTVCREYRDTPGPTVPDSIRVKFAEVRAEFLSQVPRLPTHARGELLAWETEAIEWGQNNGPSGPEDRAWRLAMESCGLVETDSFAALPKRPWWKVF